MQLEELILWALGAVGSLGIALFYQMVKIASTNADIKTSLLHVLTTQEKHESKLKDIELKALERYQLQTEKIHGLEIKILQRSK